MADLTIDSLTFAYATASAHSLSEVSFTVEHGEFVAVTGANNSGKSSLCYALSGVIPHFYHGRYSGSVKVGTTEVAKHSISELTRKVGLVMQNPSNQLSGARFTVFEEVAFGLENMGRGHADIIGQVTEALAVVGLSEEKDLAPHQLSGGQLQKLAFASVLAMSPEVLVLDEPTTFLDPQGARMVFCILQELKRLGKTIVIAEQNLEWIAEFADRVIVLSEGRIVLVGTPEEVLADKKIKEVGLDWMVYTRTAELAREQGLWKNGRPLPVTFADAVKGFLRS